MGAELEVREASADIFLEMFVSVDIVLNDDVLLSLPSHPVKSANEMTYNRANSFMISVSIGYLLLLIELYATRSTPKINKQIMEK